MRNYFMFHTISAYFEKKNGKRTKTTFRRLKPRQSLKRFVIFSHVFRSVQFGGSKSIYRNLFGFVKIEQLNLGRQMSYLRKKDFRNASGVKLLSIFFSLNTCLFVYFGPFLTTDLLLQCSWWKSIKLQCCTFSLFLWMRQILRWEFYLEQLCIWNAIERQETMQFKHCDRIQNRFFVHLIELNSLLSKQESNQLKNDRNFILRLCGLKYFIHHISQLR